MLATLRRRLILSHLLPLFVVIPLMGIALIYVLETKVILPELADELTGEAALVARLASDQPDLWDDPTQAASFLSGVDPHLDARLMLFDSEGRLLASSDPADFERMGQQLDQPGLSSALAGLIFASTTYSRNLHAEVADVWFPVHSSGRDNQLTCQLRIRRPAQGCVEECYPITIERRIGIVGQEEHDPPRRCGGSVDL